MSKFIFLVFITFFLSSELFSKETSRTVSFAPEYLISNILPDTDPKEKEKSSTPGDSLKEKQLKVPEVKDNIELKGYHEEETPLGNIQINTEIPGVPSNLETSSNKNKIDSNKDDTSVINFNFLYYLLKEKLSESID